MMGRLKKKKRSGMTLVELLVASFVAVLMFVVVAHLVLFTVRSFVALSNYDALDRASMHALDIMSRDIRQTRSLTSFATNRLTFEDYDGAQLTFVWNPNPTNRTLTRIKGTESKVLLTQCDHLNFSVYQRNPSNEFIFYPAATPDLAKLIAVNWKCSRQILQKKVNTESAQTATIVIRN